ncbi:MAG: hypothetical protein ACJA01_002592 [Saprospiraceae bacterium]|jgi:hypothetical protein
MVYSNLLNELKASMAADVRMMDLLGTQILIL